ncbi:MAG TPA: GNAT family N-acetyltransferase [Rhodospirillales bacterium]|nr:GNAT family N-acetyltransferase [Rhodospirillales bacterium]
MSDPSTQSTLRFRDISPQGVNLKVWDDLVDQCPDAWFMHTSAFHRYIAAATGEPFENASFVVENEGRPIALAPLAFGPLKLDGYEALEAGYYGGPLPWPCFLPGADKNGEMELAAFAEAERRAISCGAKRIRYMLSPPQPGEDDILRFARVVSKRHYLDTSYPSHWMALDHDAESGVRSRYKRYVKKFSKDFDLRVSRGGRLGDDLEQAYFDLHVKDSGGMFRSRESYTEMANMAREGLGFFVSAHSRDSGGAVGVLVVLVHKNHAYDASVAVDPAYQDAFVSHLLKWQAIRTLSEDGAKSYELGRWANKADWNWTPGQKNFGISFFKQGWSRDGVKSVLVAEKFFDRDALNHYCAGLARTAADYFEC